MNIKHLYLIILILGLLNIVTIIAFFALFSKTSNSTENQSSSHQHQNVEVDREKVELAKLMGDIQRFSDKLYFAGKNQNWKLAKFYLHELEETTEEIEKSNITEDGHNISQLIGTMLGSQIEATEKSLLNSPTTEVFETHYKAMINACNTCHSSTEHDFIQISIPTTPTYQNQIYTIKVK